MILATTKFEESLWDQDYKLIAGIDEVGRGCWAGPLVVAAVIFPLNFKTQRPITDSKLLNAKTRIVLNDFIKQNSICFNIAEIQVEQINDYGISSACQLGYTAAVSGLTAVPDYILIDAFKIKSFPDDKQQAIIKGDQQSISIAAASIIAKVYRDNLMLSLHQTEPRYGFDKNVGYGTKFHQKALAKYGLSKYHRTSFNLNKWIL